MNANTLPLLMEVFWKSGVVLGVALCVAGLLRKKSADVRRVVLSTAIVALFVAATASRALPHWTAVTPAWHQTSAAIAVTSTRAIMPVSRTENQTLIRTAKASGAIRRPPLWTPDVIALIWCTGTAIFLVRLMVGLFGLRWLRNSSTLLTEAGLSAAVTLLENESLRAPVTWGIVRPVILVPTRFRQLPAESREAILRHELGHIEGLDFLLRVLADTARALIWFQPLVWMARRRLREEQELACDNRVVAAGGKPSMYAKLLMEWDVLQPRGNVQLAVGMAQESCLKRRLYALLNQDLQRGALSRAGAITTWFLGLATALLLATMSVTSAAPLEPPRHPLRQESPTAQTATATPAFEALPVKTPAMKVPPVQVAQALTAAQPAADQTPAPELLQLAMQQLEQLRLQLAQAAHASQGAVVLLILDTSASMEGQKIELLRKAANAVIDNLRPGDQVGILTFNQLFQWTAPIQNATDKASLKQLITTIYPEGGTKIPEALKEGYEKMLPVGAAFRHIVLLTDGISDERDSEQTAKDAADHNITISTIGLGMDVKRAFLEKIAADGAGQSYFLNDPDALEQTMLQDVKEYTGTR